MEGETVLLCRLFQRKQNQNTVLEHLSVILDIRKITKLEQLARPGGGSLIGFYRLVSQCRRADTIEKDGDFTSHNTIIGSRRSAAMYIFKSGVFLVLLVYCFTRDDMTLRTVTLDARN